MITGCEPNRALQLGLHVHKGYIYMDGVRWMCIYGWCRYVSTYTRCMSLVTAISDYINISYICSRCTMYLIAYIYFNIFIYTCLNIL